VPAAPSARAHWRFRVRTLTSVVLGVGALAAAAALLAVPEATGAPTTEAVTDVARSVAVAQVDDRPHLRELRFAGVVRAHRRAELGFVLSGRVDERLVELGDHVEAGQALVRLDRRQLRRAVEVADAVVARTEADLSHGRIEQGRVAELSAVDAVAASATDDADHTISVAVASRRQASSQAKAARRDLAEGVIVAPFAGRVARVDVEPGELVAGGQSVLEIVGDDALELEVQLPESMLADVHEGMSLPIELPLLDQTLTGRVRTIGAAAPQTAGLFPVIVELPEGAELRAGMTARLVVTSSVGTGLTVPVEAVIDRSGENPKVLTVTDGKVNVRPVHVVAIAGRDAVVAAELDAGEWVVTRGHTGLADGDEVIVRR
jgi:RND family efflux transporter MFP subunit